MTAHNRSSGINLNHPINQNPLNIYIVGAGNIGGSIALTLPHTTIAGVYTRSHTTANALTQAGYTNSIDVSHFGEKLAQANCVLICVSDKHIQTVAEQIYATGMIQPNTLMAHMSGALSIECLKPLEQRSFYYASIHPLIVCSNYTLGIQRLKRATYALSGEHQALCIAQQLVETLQGTWFYVPDDKKSHYHAACVLSSNLMLGLLAASFNQLQHAGIGLDVKHMAALSLQALESAHKHGIAEGLTGPLKRGDIETIQKHLAILSSENAELYRMLCEQLLPYLTPHARHVYLQDLPKQPC